MDEIHIKDLLLRCIIGVHDWERQVIQDVVINVTLFTDLTAAGHSDQLQDTVDYKSLTKQIIALTENTSYFLVEALAEGIAQLALTHSRVQRVRVQVEKPGALRFARSVGVCIDRSPNPAPLCPPSEIRLNAPPF